MLVQSNRLPEHFGSAPKYCLHNHEPPMTDFVTDGDVNLREYCCIIDPPLVDLINKIGFLPSLSCAILMYMSV